MPIFAINSLSAVEQCFTTEDISSVVGGLVSCLDFLEPGIKAGTIALLYDASVEHRNLVAQEHFTSSLNRLYKIPEVGHDQIRKWFLYTKNRAQDVTDAGTAYTFSCPNGTFSDVSGELSTALLSEHLGWISFGGAAFGDASTYRIVRGAETVLNPNASHLMNFTQLVPVYQASPKHRKERYFDKERQEWVAPMPLDSQSAQSVLTAAVRVGSDYFGRHDQTRTYYRFKPTRDLLFHGFQIDVKDLPPEYTENGQ